MAKRVSLLRVALIPTLDHGLSGLVSQKLPRKLPAKVAPAGFRPNGKR